MKKRIKKPKMPGKTASHTKSIIKSLVLELARAEKIKTTEAKGKILKTEFDKLVTVAKKDTLAGRQKVLSFFGNNEAATTRFFDVVKTKLNDRTSGYTRVFHTTPRKGDGARQVYVMLVNAEIKEKVSKAQKLVAKRKEKEEEKSVTGRLKKVTKKVTAKKQD